MARLIGEVFGLCIILIIQFPLGYMGVGGCNKKEPGCPESLAATYVAGEAVVNHEAPSCGTAEKETTAGWLVGLISAKLV